MDTFIIATNNEKKLLELNRILNPMGITSQTARQAGICLDNIEETGTTFEENARIKARAAFILTGKPSIADDSGLMVDALNGAPGVYTARYSGENATDKSNIEKLLYEMRDKPQADRTAHFVTTICCILNDGTEIIATGKCTGTIGFEPIGNGGFGYDPIFMTRDGKSFAQLSADEKDKISHRGNAIRQLKKKLEKCIKSEEI
ncbi:MAG TPA: RdgB/HAM1 family non-canonical purine NTP pyrophosphatase [Clostridiales bacterium]|nr:RdgB/HAM1 family non-canonical purine NTP pyrophosphatase [Clostridiales bacterium]